MAFGILKSTSAPPPVMEIFAPSPTENELEAEKLKEVIVVRSQEMVPSIIKFVAVKDGVVVPVAQY